MTELENRTGWSAVAPSGHTLEITMSPSGWRVVFGGFSRADNHSLSAALAEATGTRHDAAWIRDIVLLVEGDHAADVGGDGASGEAVDAAKTAADVVARRVLRRPGARQR